MIRVQNVSLRFKDRLILENVNFEVAAGSALGIIGPSGAGKSVLLKMIAGLVSPTKGQIEVQSKKVSMLFQKNALFDSFTVQENLLFPLRERRKITGTPAKKLAAHFLSAVGLKGCEELYPDEISGGMQKRLGIARALIVQPEIILYDEPTAGLDPITSKTIADLIQDLRCESKSTLLTVTNDMQRAYQLGDRLFLLAQGRLTFGGTPKEVQSTQDPSIRQFIYGLKKGPLTSGLM